MRGWAKGLAPYVLRTLTLQRPINNWRIRRATRSNGADEYSGLDINGHKQWLRIRGESTLNPVILYLHGGPGGSQIPSYRHYQLAWEQEFTIVHWEQRGAGRSFTNRLDPDSMTITQLVSDGKEVISYLAKRFNRSDIILLGHSWGSLLGIHLLRAHPKQISAYVGIGQIANQIKSEQRMHTFASHAAAKDGNQKAIAQLENLQGYPLTRCSPRDVACVRQWARHYGYLGSGSSDTGRTYLRLMDTPEYSLGSIYRFLKGTLVSSDTLGKSMLTDPAIQPDALPLEFDVPIFFISGQRDHFTPADLTDEYLDKIQSPEKRHVIFEDSGHYPNEDEPERFINTLQDLVGPYITNTNKQQT